MYKRVMLIVAVLGLLSGLLAYARGRDMDLKTVEVRQQNMQESMTYMRNKIDAIHLLLINNRVGCPNSDKKEGK